jgi:hypothetical protein
MKNQEWYHWRPILWFLFFVEEFKIAAYVKGTIGKRGQVILERSQAIWWTLISNGIEWFADPRSYQNFGSVRKMSCSMGRWPRKKMTSLVWCQCPDEVRLERHAIGEVMQAIIYRRSAFEFIESPQKESQIGKLSVSSLQPLWCLLESSPSLTLVDRGLKNSNLTQW